MKIDLEKIIGCPIPIDRFVVYVAKYQNRFRIYDVVESKFVIDYEQSYLENFSVKILKNGTFVINSGRKIFILKLDDIMGKITMKYETNFDFEFDDFNKSVLKIEGEGSFHFNLCGKNRKDGLIDYFNVFKYT